MCVCVRSYGDLEWIPDIFVPFGFVTVGNDVRGTGMEQETVYRLCV